MHDVGDIGRSNLIVIFLVTLVISLFYEQCAKQRFIGCWKLDSLVQWLENLNIKRIVMSIYVCRQENNAMNNFVIHTTPQRVALCFANYSIFLQRRQQTINYLDFDDDNTRIFLIFFFLFGFYFMKECKQKNW